MEPSATVNALAIELPDGLVEVGSYRSAAEGFDRGLVVLATGENYWLVPEGDRHRLLVPAESAAHVRGQLARYERENRNWPPAPLIDAATTRPDLLTPFCWMIAVVAVFQAQHTWPGLAATASLDARALLDHGETWRPLTALFVHADADHLLSNALSGMFVFAAWLSTVGRVRGWLLLGLAAITGNVVSAALHYPREYHSLGASTAVFAALGLLTGRALRIAVGRGRGGRTRAWFLPLASGLTVLALYGAGQQPVDVVAHVAGFLAGLGVGFCSSTGVPPVD